MVVFKLFHTCKGDPKMKSLFSMSVALALGFAGIVRAPMTSVLMIFEMTGSYGLVLPLMIANMTAYALTRRRRYMPIYEALLEQDGIRLPHNKPVTPETELREFPGEAPP